MKRPIGIDLFAGAGGMSLGFEQAGFDIAAAVEIDPIHAAVHAFNFPDTAVLARSVVGLTGDEIRAAAGIGDAAVDVVFGGPPCQGFSLIGRRAIDDPRNQLVKEFVRIVEELDSKHFVFENVKGLTVGSHSAILKDLIVEFELRGYDVLGPWKVLNAAHYGVPQNRERLFLIGSKRGCELPNYPAALTNAAGQVSINNALPTGPSCHDALADIPDAELFDTLIDSDEAKVTWKEASLFAKRLRGLVNESDDFSYPRRWDTSRLTSSLRTEHTAESRSRFADCPNGQVEKVSRFFKLPADGVANTLRAGTDSARGAFTSPRPIHYRFARCVTVREMMRLHGYPDWFRTHVTKWHGARQVGNSVPPPLAKAVATEVIKAIGATPARPVATLQLGSPTLLSMGMSEAAAFFGIEIPIGQRTRKPERNVTADNLPAFLPER